MKKTLIVAALALTAAACGGSSKKTTPSGATFACNFPADGECLEFSGPAAAVSAAYGSAQCTADLGSVVSACPATARVGRCTVTDPQAQLTLVYHIYSGDAATLQQACTQGLGGTWTAG